MGIFRKLSTLIRSNITDVISRAENPEKMLNQVITDMREQLGRAKQDVAVAIADERKLRGQVEEEQRRAGDWEARAVLAVGEEREDLARQALLRQEQHLERAATLEEAWRRQAQETQELKAALQQLNDRIEEAGRRKTLLLARQKRAQAQDRIRKTIAGLSDRSAFETFERVAEKIDDAERMGRASDEVRRATEGDALEREFARLEHGGDVDQRLEALKERMSLPGAADDEAEMRRLEPARTDEREDGDDDGMDTDTED